jgi:RNA polymerase sigma-70 factor (ECF subfamily)
LERDLDLHLAAIAAGDADAFAAWVAPAEPALRRSLASFARVVDTEAILQEGLLRVWQVAPRVERDGRPNALLRLANRICRNLAIDAARRARRQLPSPEPTPDPITPEPPDPLLRDAIARCREKLPPRPAEALTLRLAGGGDDRMLASRAEMTLNTFLKNVGRARKLLGDCLTRAGVDWRSP